MLIEGNIENYSICLKSCEKVDYVLHQAAIGSVPRSIKDPIFTNKPNGILMFLTQQNSLNLFMLP